MAERKITLSEERFGILFENAPDIIYFTDLNGIIWDANRAAPKAVQFDKKDWIGKNISELRLAGRGKKENGTGLWRPKCRDIIQKPLIKEVLLSKTRDMIDGETGRIDKKSASDIFAD